MEILSGTRIFLREFAEADWLAVHEYASIPEASRFQPWGPNSEDESKKYIQEILDASTCTPRTRYAFAVIEKLGNRLIGAVELNHVIHKERGELAYIIHPDHWGKGFATEAASLLLVFGFCTLDLKIIEATGAPDNIGSGKVLRKIGMTHEGTLHNHLRVKDRWRDSSIYSLSESEWRKKSRVVHPKS